MYVAIVEAHVFENDNFGEVIDDKRVHIYCSPSHAKQAKFLLAENLTPVYAGIDKEGNVWTITQG